MRNDLPAIVMSREEHLAQIASYWRHEQANRLREEVLFEDDERVVASALYEREPWPVDRRPIDWSIARDLAGALALNFAGLGFGGLLLFEMLR